MRLRSEAKKQRRLESKAIHSARALTLIVAARGQLYISACSRTESQTIAKPELAHKFAEAFAESVDFDELRLRAVRLIEETVAFALLQHKKFLAILACKRHTRTRRR